MKNLISCLLIQFLWDYLKGWRLENFFRLLREILSKIHSNPCTKPILSSFSLHFQQLTEVLIPILGEKYSVISCAL